MFHLRYLTEFPPQAVWWYIRQVNVGYAVVEMTPKSQWLHNYRSSLLTHAKSCDGYEPLVAALRAALIIWERAAVVTEAGHTNHISSFCELDLLTPALHAYAGHALFWATQWCA